jgi:hypothetical protein
MGASLVPEDTNSVSGNINTEKLPRSSDIINGLVSTPNLLILIDYD